jgi:hypothetical protein
MAAAGAGLHRLIVLNAIHASLAIVMIAIQKTPVGGSQRERKPSPLAQCQAITA